MDSLASYSILIKSDEIIDLTRLKKGELALECNHAKFIFLGDPANEGYRYRVSRIDLESIIAGKFFPTKNIQIILNIVSPSNLHE